MTDIDLTSLSDQVATLLQEYRSAHELTQVELAERLGWKQSVVARFESGNRHLPSLLSLMHIARALHMTLTLTMTAGRITLRHTRARSSPRMVVDDAPTETDAVTDLPLAVDDE